MLRKDNEYNQETLYHIGKLLSRGKIDPNPDIGKVHVADRLDLERFFKRRIPDSSNCLPIPYQERTAPVGHGHSLVFGQTTPLALSLVGCIRLVSPIWTDAQSKRLFPDPSKQFQFL